MTPIDLTDTEPFYSEDGRVQYILDGFTWGKAGIRPLVNILIRNNDDAWEVWHQGFVTIQNSALIDNQGISVPYDSFISAVENAHADAWSEFINWSEKEWPLLDCENAH